MKICHIITRMILGGAMENTLLTCEGLHARGHEVSLITGPALGPEGELMTRARAGGYKLIVIDEMRRAIHPILDWRASRRIVACLRDLRPEIVHTHASKAGILGRRAAAKVRGQGRGIGAQGEDMKIVHTVHGLAFHPYQGWWKNWLYIWLERAAARRTDAIISVADAMTRQALAAGVGRAEQYTTIYSGMEVEKYLHRPAEADALRASLHLPAAGVLVTQVSRLAELKGHDFLLEAASRIGDERVHFCLVGDGELRAKIEAEIARLGLGGRFHLTGLLPPEQIPAVMHASDILVHCSLREGLPRTLPQALLAGKPVVAFDVDGTADVCTADTGVLLRPGDVGGLTLALGLLAGSAELRARLGQGGRELCRIRFDHNMMVHRIEEIYRRMMG